MDPQKEKSNDAKARYVMIGGFLGAGKTTAIAAFAQHLVDRDVRVGLISNDQSTGLVDTKLLRSQGFPVEEITGGCFCCRFNSLLEASEKLTRDIRPEVFLAEPVGSCTDLVSTVSYPLRRIYGDRFIVSPLSVLVDPDRAAKILGIKSGKPFSEKVAYIYKKQLEEADVIVVNKCDELDDALREALTAKLTDLFPGTEIFSCSARNGDGLEGWFKYVLARECDATKATMAVDYELYAEGEAKLGWLNCTVRLSASAPFDGNVCLLALAAAVRDRIRVQGGEIAHLKMTLDAGDPTGNLSVVNLVQSSAEPDLRESFLDDLTEGELIINLRAELDPEALRAVITECLEGIGESQNGLRGTIEHIECFRPGKPEPTHRLSGGESAAART